MEINEFIDTYSDDVIYLHEGRSALLTHPLVGYYALKENLDASFCRLFAVFMIGSIEVMIEEWRDRDHIHILDTYFAKDKKNGDRVSSLYDAFRDAGIPVDRQVFDDYLAIKYLRNTIVHGRWKEDEKEWLDRRGFPIDTRELTKDHLDRIEHVNQNMMLYISLSRLAVPNAAKSEKLIKLEETVTRHTDKTGILLSRDIDRIIWNNLERIDALIYADIERAAISAAYDWTAGRGQTELNELGLAECQKMFYLVARRAGEENYEPLAQHRVLAKEALAFWQEYWQRAVASRGLQEGSIEQGLEVFQSLHFENLAPKLPWGMVIESMPDDYAHQLVDVMLESDAPFRSGQIVDALRAGRLTWELIPNIMPVALLTLRLPIVDPANTTQYLQEADRALRAFRLNRAWYSWTEHHSAPDEGELDFYCHMRQELAKCAREGETR